MRAVPSSNPLRANTAARVVVLLALYLVVALPAAALTLGVQIDAAATGRFEAPAPAAKNGGESPATTAAQLVIPILLPPQSDVRAVRAPWPVVHLGTGAYHGFAIAHLAVPQYDIPAAARGGARIEIDTAPARFRTARLQRPDALRLLDARREVERLVVNPEALAFYADPPVEPAAPAPAVFRPTATPTLEGSPVEMLILTPQALAGAFQAYADYRTGLGVPTVVRSIEWVQQNYPHGADLAETLRDFVRQAYELWGIRSLLLGGDTDPVPTRYATSVYSLGGESVPTDLYYACLDGSWNDDGDERWGEGFVYAENSSDLADLYPELLVGRLPVMTPEHVSAYLAKLRAYVEPSVLDYQGKLAFLAEVIWPASYKQGDPIIKNGADNAERIIQSNGLASRAGVDLTRLYETPQYYAGAAQLTRAAGIAAMENGHGLITDIGHGYRYTMSLGDASLTNVQALGLTNGTRPFFLNALNCSSSAYDFPCLAEKFLLNPNGGAIGVIGASREAYPDNMQLYQEAWFQKLFTDGYAGAAEALHEARLRWLSQTYEDGAYRWSNFITAYLGDPELVVWLGPPRAPAVTHAASVQLGPRDLAVTVTTGGAPAAGATVCLWKPGDFYAVARTNLAGTAHLVFTAETPGAADLAVVGAGLAPYRAEIAVLGIPGVSLRATGVVQVQDSGPGTFGNGNGVLEATETALVRIEVENQGTITADAVTLQLYTTSPALQLPGSAVSVGDLPSGGRTFSSPLSATVAGNVLDQYPVPVDVVLRTLQSWTWTDRLTLDVLQVAPRVRRIWVDDQAAGNANGLPDPNETYDLWVELGNDGFGTLRTAAGQLLALDPDVTILAGTASFGDIAHLAATNGSFRVRETDVAAPNRMLLVVLDAASRAWSFPIETRRPDPPSGLAGDPSAGPGLATLTWQPSPSGDVAGYHIYRAARTIGPWTRASTGLVQHATYFRDDGLQNGARYYYAVAAVDSSGNESARTSALELSTNPGQLAGWPQTLGMWSNSSPVVADLEGDRSLEIVTGASDHVYAWHADGTEVRDGDGNPSTSGVFHSASGNFMPGLAAADLDRDGRDEIVACTFDTKQVYVFEGDGSVRAGWPRPIVSTTHGIWATPALGDLDLDGDLEIVLLALDGMLYAWHADGTEVRDGDANPSTQGVFYAIPALPKWSRGAPAIANVLPGDATPEIVFGTDSAKIYMLRADGSVAPGWPRSVGDRVQAAPSIGDLDGDGTLEIAVASRDGKLYVLRPDGTDLPGWPRPLVNQWNAITPSVALADLDRDGKLELVAGSTGGAANQGSLHVFDWQGNVRAGWPVDVASASEASPLVGDLDSDGTPEILYGGESGVLYAFRPDGRLFSGFPLRVGAEVRATPLMTDVDGDRGVDVVFSGWDQQVYVWDFAGLYVRRNTPWGAFKGNLLRNGIVDYREPTDRGDETVAAPPLRTALHANVPNPFNPTTTLLFDLGGSAPQLVRLRLFDAAGRRVRTLVDRVMSPGRYVERWDGRDDTGRTVSSGVYFARLETPDRVTSRKLVLMR